MIALLEGFGLGRLAARLVAWVGVPLLVLVAVWLWGNARYSAGVKAERASWVAASEKLKAAAAASAGTADAAAAASAAEYAAKVEREREAINAQVSAGGSALDGLFPKND